MNLPDQLRQAIEDSGLTLYRIAKGSGIAYPVLHRFASGERDLTLTTASRLADYFGMRLTRPKRPKYGGRNNEGLGFSGPPPAKEAGR